MSNSHLHLSLSADTDTTDEIDLSPASTADYNAAVVALVQKHPLEVDLTKQADLAKESAVKEGIHSIQIGVQTYAIDHNDIYPAKVTKAILGSYVENWPDNPYTNVPMTEGAGPGSYTYMTNGSTFKLVGRGKDGKIVITVP